MLALALVLALGQATGHGRAGGPIVSQPNTMGAFAAFEFAPASGAGMGSVCAGTIPTGAKGETLTFTRASSATCLKSASMTSGIVAGDMYSLSSNQPRIMYGSYSVTPILGFLAESTRTNTTLRSEEFDNATWQKTPGVGGTAPVVTADQAAGLFGATTADRVVISAASGAQESVMFQASACPVGTSTSSVYIIGNGSSGSIDHIINLGGGNFACSTCSFNSSTWSRCVVTGVVASSGNQIFGAEPTIAPCGTSARSAADVYMWGAQCELGAWASSYIPTTSATVARAVDSPLRLSTLPAGISTTGSSAATLIPFWSTTVAGVTPQWLYRDAAGILLYGADSATARVFDGTNTVSVANSVTAGTAERWASSWTGSTLSIFADTNTSGSFDSTMGSASTLDMGSGTGGNEANGVLKLVCLDPDPTRCR